MSFTVIPPAPAITDFNPRSGSVGEPIVIAGTNFTGLASVKFNGVPANYTVDSDTKIIANVPNGCSSGLLEITTGGGTVTSSTGFTVGAINGGGGGISAITIEDEGSNIAPNVTSIDFVGAGVAASAIDNAVIVTIPGGGVSSEGLTWSEMTSTFSTLIPGNGYIANNSQQVSLVLPRSSIPGDLIAVAGKGTGKWRITQGENQSIHLGANSTVIGTNGVLEALDQYSCAELVCVQANTDWVVRSYVGNLSINTKINPASFAGLQVWDRSDKVVLDSNSNIQQWTDRSGNNNHATQSSAGNRPSYISADSNGFPSIVFNGNQWLLDNYLGEPKTILVVGMVTETANSNRGWRGAKSNSSTAIDPRLDAYYFKANDPASIMSFLRTTTTANSPAEAITVKNQFYCQTGLFDETNIKLYKDTVLVASNKISGSPISINEFSVIGATYYNNTVVDLLIGKIQELIIYNQALSDADLQSLWNNYINPRYKLF